MTAPVSPEQIDGPWLSATLGQGEIVGVSGQSIGTGQVGENVRFHLTWADADDGRAADDTGTGEIGRPATVVGKFPSSSETSLAAAHQTGVYVTEVGFYRDLCSEVTIRTPEVYHVGFDEGSGRFSILMEDIAPAEQGDQLAGTDSEIAEMVVDEAVGLHAPTWGRAEELAKLSWLDLPTIESARERSGLHRHFFPGFAERYRSVLSAEDMEVGNELVAKLDVLLDAQFDGIAPSEWCLTHGDYRLDNMLFGLGDSAPPITVVDWQTCRIGSGPSDIAYFCGAGMDPATRALYESPLVDRYVAGLVAAGVDADRDELWYRYVLGSASGYLMAVIASQIVEQTERGDAMFCAMAAGHAEQMRHLNLFDLIS